MKYEVTFSAAASRQIKKLPPDLRINLIALAETLAANPRPSGVVKLEGDENAYRIRFRDYRIVYEIYDDKLIVVVIKVGHRRNIYR
jgi:mRNA interferase RelE/StbE